MINQKTGNIGGRPNKLQEGKSVKDPLKLIKYLASIQCSTSEIATALDIDPSTLLRNKTYAVEIEKGRDVGKTSLRRAMFKSALAGNATMQIWLSKQLLGYKEKIMSEENKNTVLTLRYSLPNQEGENGKEESVR